MRAIALGCCLTLLAGCSGSEGKPADNAASGAAPATPLEAVAGKWTMHTMGPTSDSVLLTFELVASADPTGWSFRFPGREPVPVRIVAAEGDSVVSEAGPYESALRPGVQVTTRSVMRLKDGELVGTTEAVYAGGPDSVLMLRTHGVRAHQIPGNRPE